MEGIKIWQESPLSQFWLEYPIHIKRGRRSDDINFVNLLPSHSPLRSWKIVTPYHPEARSTRWSQVPRRIRYRFTHWRRERLLVPENPDGARMLHCVVSNATYTMKESNNSRNFTLANFFLSFTLWFDLVGAILSQCERFRVKSIYPTWLEDISSKVSLTRESNSRFLSRHPCRRRRGGRGNQQRSRTQRATRSSFTLQREREFFRDVNFSRSFRLLVAVCSCRTRIKGSWSLAKFTTFNVNYYIYSCLLVPSLMFFGVFLAHGKPHSTAYSILLPMKLIVGYFSLTFFNIKQCQVDSLLLRLAPSIVFLFSPLSFFVICVSAFIFFSLFLLLPFSQRYNRWS